MEIRYWRSLKGYQRLVEDHDGSSSVKKVKSAGKNVKRVKMDPSRKKRFWRIKIVRKLRILKKATPKKLLTWLRDSYVNMMLRLANTRVVGSYGYGEYGSGYTSKEYDEKKLVETHIERQESVMEIRYWRSLKGYQRLVEDHDGSSSVKKVKSAGKNVKRIKMDPSRKKRFWRIKIVRKLRILKKATPKKLLTWLRDSYVNMMLRLANTRVVGSYGYGEYGSGYTSKEYDEKKLVEIYKSILMAQGNIVHPDVPKLSDVPTK